MGKFIAGALAAILLLAAVGYAYLVSGLAPVATDSAPLPLERFFARTALHAVFQKHADAQPPFTASDERLVDGAKVYVHDCAVCHGLPGEPPTAIAKGMFPLPPQLFAKDEMVTDDPVGATYWKAQNGIRLSGMPGFGKTLKDEELWEVSLLLAGADKLPPAVVAELHLPVK